MVPIQFMIIMALAGAGIEIQGTHNAWPVLAAWLGVAGFLGALVGLVIVVAARARGALWAIHGSSGNPAEIKWSVDQVANVARWVSAALVAGLVFGTGVPRMLNQWLEGVPVLRDLPTAELIVLVPVILAWIGFWTASYFVSDAARQRQMPFLLAQGLPTHEMPSLMRYLSMQCRHSFFLLIPLAIEGGIMLAGQFATKWIPYADAVAVPVGILVMLLTLPGILVWVWSTEPLGGQLREKLERIAAQHRLRFRNILVWKTHNVVTNAMILGWMPFSRYFLMTDALLETLTDRQLEAVFSHEVGHGVKGHIWWYLGATFGALLFSGGCAALWTGYMPAGIANFAGDAEGTQGVISLGLLGVLGIWGFPKISHGFEHQADWFACRQMAREMAADPTARGLVGAQVLAAVPTAAEGVTLDQYMAGAYPHGAAGMAATGKISPMVAGTEVFISALDGIVELGHKSREKHGWSHPSINHRNAFLRKLAAEEGGEGQRNRQFERRMVWTRLGILALLAAGIGTTALGIWQEGRAGGKDVPPAHSEPAGPDGAGHGGVWV